MTDPYPPAGPGDPAGQAGPVGRPGPADTPSPAGSAGKSRLNARQIGALVALVLLVVFIVENTRKVKIRFIIPEVKAPLFVALLLAALVGALAMWLIQHRLQGRKKRRA